jgi:hypothetical protein
MQEPKGIKRYAIESFSAFDHLDVGAEAPKERSDIYTRTSENRSARYGLAGSIGLLHCTRGDRHRAGPGMYQVLVGEAACFDAGSPKGKLTRLSRRSS